MHRIRALAVCFALVSLVAPVAAEETVLDQARRIALAGLPVLRGAAMAPRDLAGKVVVVAFFASWCPPCGPEFDNLKAVHAGHDAVVLAVNIFETWGGLGGPARLTRFLDGKAPDFTVLGGGDEVASLFGDVDRIPTVFVFGRDGRTILHFVHATGATKTHATLDELEAAVRSAL